MNYSFKLLLIVIFIIISVLFFVACNKATTPAVKISNISYITPTTTTVFASVTDDGGEEVTSRGVCWNTSENPIYSGNKTLDGEGSGSYSSIITNLLPETKYFVRAYATNSEGVGYSKQESFNTSAELPDPTITTALTAYTTSEAHIHCNISNEGGAMVTVSGVCWSTSQNPSITGSHSSDGSPGGEYASLMTGLAPDTKYFVKAYATTINGIFYGNEISFTTLSESDGTVADYDGNIYSVVSIGTQRWITENLRSATFNDGTAIPKVTDQQIWDTLTASAYCWYDNNETYKNISGALYNWYAVEGGDLCPSGWHVPNREEWTALVDFLGGWDIAGGKLKEPGTEHWQSPNAGATDESGFQATPGGERIAHNGFAGGGYGGHWYSTTESDEAAGAKWDFQVSYLSEKAGWTWLYYKDGGSVRCLKD